MDLAAEKVAALRKILELEATRGFTDVAVTGGLDRFLNRWRAELESELGVDPTRGKPYAELSPDARRAWAQAVMRPRTAPPPARAGGDSPAAVVLTTPGKRRPVEKQARPAAQPAGHRRREATAPSLGATIQDLKLVTRPVAEKLQRIGVVTLRDLLYLFPSRHIDYAHVNNISEIMPGTEATVVATVWEAAEARVGPGPGATRAVISDGTGTMSVTWFRQPYLAKRLSTGTRLVLSGKVLQFRGRPQFQNPEYEMLGEGPDDELVHAGNLLPVYPSTEGLAQRTLRTAAKKGLDIGLPLISEYMPAAILERGELLPLHAAIARMHLPATAEEKESARRRLAFDELFLNQVGVQLRRIEWRKRGEGVAVEVDRRVADKFIRSLPFWLTGGQREALDQILTEISGDVPMSRLLQGEVGSGKTVVAIAALLTVAAAGLQGTLMAPTEVLAEQHFLNLCSVLGAVAVFGVPDAIRVARTSSWQSGRHGPEPRAIKIGLLIGSLPARIKSAVQREIAGGAVDICVGTHALIQDAVEIPRLAMAVVDEQHRFGVEQRAALKQKGLKPHLLAMSATPIPRSLALTLYGDLDLSTLRELPGGRKPIDTVWVTDADGRRSAYQLVRTQVAAGRQAFIVCPLIDPSEEVKGRSAIEEHANLSANVFPDLRVGLLHGRMSLAEKQSIMERFRSGDLQVLVATPVIEVGIDIANATVMMIESADRFGLSQLHQLRGRVGRGEHKSHCVLLADDPSGDAQERLATVARTSDGFDLAEKDLAMRGPGDYLGTRQSGFADLKVATLADMDLLMSSRSEAERLLADDPALRLPQNRPLAREVAAAMAQRPAEIS
jgi:ATP-dependent DNA helicase RecG